MSASAETIDLPGRAVEPVERAKPACAALAGLCLAMLMPSLATSSVNAALPMLADSFGAPFQAAQWILLAYLLAITAAIVIAGRLGDMFGRRRVLIVGIVGFGAASLLCGVARTLPLLIAARGVQGLGAAIMMALTMALVADVVPRARMGRAMGLLGTMSAIGTTLGPSLGGVLLASAGWPAIFLINVPLGLVALGLLIKTLPADAPSGAITRDAFDLPGMALLLGGLTAYALAMTVGRGDFGPLNIGLLLAATTAGASFLANEARASSPLIQLGLFRDPLLRTGLAASALVSTVMMATLVVGPFYLSRALGLGVVMLGIALSAGPLVATVAGIPAGRLVDRFGTDDVATAGLAALLLGALAVALAPMRWGVAAYLLPLTLMTAGYAMSQAANNTAVIAAATPAQRGLVSALLNLARNLGLVTGASAMGAVFALMVGADVATAAPGAIAFGMRTSFWVAALLVALALALTLRRAPRWSSLRARDAG